MNNIEIALHDSFASTTPTRIPAAVICLVSALSFHEITTQIPHEVSIALPRDMSTPRIDYPPIETHRFSEASYKAGVEEHIVDNVSVKIYSPEKTIVDCFKFRNKIGMDIFLEALKLYRTRKNFNYSKLLDFAKVCRVEKLIVPYLEAML